MTETSDLRGMIYALIAEFSGTNQIIAIPKFYVELTGDLRTAGVLAQIIYMSERSADGWAELPHDYWADLFGMTPHMVRTSVATLEPFGVLTKRVPSAGKGNPLSYSVDRDVLIDQITERLHFQKSKNFTFKSENFSLSYNESEDVKERSIPAESETTVTPKKRRKAELDLWYDAVKAVWGFEASLNANYQKWLRGEPAGNGYAKYPIDPPLTSHEQLLAWAEWYQREKQGSDDLDMLAKLEKVQSSIAEWRESLADKRREKRTKREAPPIPAPKIEPIPVFKDGKLTGWLEFGSETDE